MFRCCCSVCSARLEVLVEPWGWPHSSRRFNLDQILSRPHDRYRPLQGSNIPRRPDKQRTENNATRTCQKIMAGDTGSSQNNRADPRDRMQNRTMNLPDSLRILLWVTYCLAVPRKYVCLPGMCFRGQYHMSFFSGLAPSNLTCGF